jgi:hypothetical protein
MNITELVELARQSSAAIQFEQVMAVIDQHYDYSPAGFSNGDVMNEAGSNEGSCKLFAFAQLNDLSEMETLPLFGQYYRDVMDNPSGNDHANIRNFILDGWLGIHFDAEPLTLKE